MSKVKQNRTVAHLLQFNEEIERSLNDFFTIADTRRSSIINEFYKNDGARIVSWNEKLNALAEEYFFIENGNVVMEDVVDLVSASGQSMAEGKKQKPKMKEGKVYEDYIKARNEILNTVIPMSI